MSNIFTHPKSCPMDGAELKGIIYLLYESFINIWMAMCELAIV